MMRKKELTLKKRTSQKRRFIFLFLLPVIITFVVFYAYSMITVFISSFMKWDYTNLANPEFLGFDNLFENYRYIFTEYPFFLEALRNSLIWAGLGVLIQVPLAVTIALALSKKLKGWKFVRNIYIIPSVISTAAMGLIFLQLYNPNHGAINQIIQFFNPDFSGAILLTPGVNIIAMTCAYIFFAAPSTMMVLGQFLAIPKEIHEAALMDNITGWKFDWYITLPIIKETVKTISILAATSGFLLYNEVFFLTNGAAGTKSISFVIRELAVSSSRTQYARANTVGVIQIIGGMLIILCINFLFRSRRKNKAMIMEMKGGDSE